MEDNRHRIGYRLTATPRNPPAPRWRPTAGRSPTELQRQRDDYYDRLLRKTAEFDNYRKRTDRERQALAEAAAADLIEELLPLVDDLERALKADAGTEGAEAYRRGVELIHRQLLEDRCASAASGRSRRSARTSIRTSTRRSRTSRPTDAARAKSSRSSAAATCSATGCCGRRW